MSTYKAFAEQVAYHAGDIIRKNFCLNMAKEWKEDDTPLTATDTAINDLVLKAVATAYPHHAVLAEEGNLDKEQTEYVWVCDPVDGTTPFSHGIPTCVFSLALVHNGIPIVGVVYDPLMNRLFSAQKECGAYMNGARIYVSGKMDIARSVIGIGYIWSQINLLGIIGNLIECKVTAVQFASNVYMGALTAAGEFMATVFAGKTPWDVAALKILVEEAGGRVTDLFGNEQYYDREIRGAIISNGHVHNRLVELVHQHVKGNV